MYHPQNAATYSVRIAILCVLSTCAPAVEAVAESSPYEARVVASSAPVQSGPGDGFYPTDTLSEGETVEVYREKAGGWLAIRPPAGSYSWVAERDLIIKDGGIAEVASDDVASRIGSRLSDRHNAAQVRLKQGESVEVLGEETINGETWCKIAPPAGEFRWIHASVVQRSEATKKLEPSSTPSPGMLAAADDNKILQTSGTEPVKGSTTPGESGAPPLLPIAKSAPPSDSPASNTLPAATATTPSTATPPTAPAANQPQPAQASGDLSHELNAIELRLSRMASAPTNLWNTDRLERDAAQLMARAQNQPERDAIRVTQDKIKRFAEIGRRAGQTNSNVAQAVRLPMTGAPNSAPAVAGGPFDAEGILRPVVSRRPGAPQFALVDERGQVISFVTATPDLNLQPYLGHRIGVVGNRGYIPEFQRSNVTAARVTPLNDRVLK